MKNNILILACLSVVLVSCQKDEVTTPSDSVLKTMPGEELNATAESASRLLYTKRVLIEEFVGTSYGDAPEVGRMINSFERNYPMNTIIAAHHHNDIMEASQTTQMVNNLTPNGVLAYPATMFNRNPYNGCRFVGSSYFQAAFNQELSQSATCGIAINSTINKGVVTLDLRESFGATINSMCTITAYLVENNVLMNSPAYYQSNNFNNNSKSVFYHKGNPMNEYLHQNVVRKFITPCMGISISQGCLKPGGTDQQTLSFQMPAEYNSNNCYIIAFISKFNGSVSDQVMNAQIAKLGTSVSW